MRVTIGDVALAAGVSNTTVSRVLNDKGQVDAGTARRVRDVIDRLGYVPSARCRAGPRPDELGRDAGAVAGLALVSQIVQGVAEILEARKYGLLLYTCTRGKESLEQSASSVAAHSCDGLLVVVPEDGMPYITRLHERGLPVVMIDDRGFGPALPTVACTNLAGGASTSRHLLDLGRQRPIVLTGRREYGCVRERLAGFAEVYRSAGRPQADEQIIEGDFTVHGGRTAIDQLARSGRGFDAVFAMNDLSVAGVIAGIRESGRTVPGDVAVIGFDDVEVAVHTNPALTTIRQPMHEMGATAAGLLLAALAGAPLPAEPTVLPTSLVVRGSTVG